MEMKKLVKVVRKCVKVVANEMGTPTVKVVKNYNPQVEQDKDLIANSFITWLINYDEQSIYKIHNFVSQKSLKKYIINQYIENLYLIDQELFEYLYQYYYYEDILKMVQSVTTDLSKNKAC